MSEDRHKLDAHAKTMRARVPLSSLNPAPPSSPSTGGHTAEMLALVSSLDPAWYSPRTYVVAATDALGPAKAAQAEEALLGKAGAGGRRRATTTTPPPVVLTIPRSREVGQSYLTSVWTTLVALAASARLVWAAKPDLLLVNGPGTCLPLVVSAVACRCVCLERGKNGRGGGEGARRRHAAGRALRARCGALSLTRTKPPSLTLSPVRTRPPPFFSASPAGRPPGSRTSNRSPARRPCP